MERTHKCGQLRHIGQQVALCGWVAGRRGLGGMIFLDIRDAGAPCRLSFTPTAPYAAAMRRSE